MTLRDRIAHVISSTSRVDECADAILSDPEIAALREVAEAARAYRSTSVPLASASYATGVGIREDKALGAALARLEEARRG